MKRFMRAVMFALLAFASRPAPGAELIWSMDHPTAPKKMWVMDNDGNTTFSGDVYQGMTSVSQADNDYIVQDNAGAAVMRVTAAATALNGGPPVGSLQIKGEIHEQTVDTTGKTVLQEFTGNAPGGGTRRVAAVTSDGDLYLLGTYAVDPNLCGGDIISHRIGTRIQSTVPQFYDTETNTEFKPDGFTFTKMFQAKDANNDQITTAALYHRQFAASVYNSTVKQEVEDMFTSMSAQCYNTVRFLNDVDTLSGTFDSGQHFNQTVIENTVDFIKRARRHGIHVYMTFVYLPWSYVRDIEGFNGLDYSIGEQGGNQYVVKKNGGFTQYKVNKEFATAYGHYINDLLTSVTQVAHDKTLLDTVLCTELWSEMTLRDNLELFGITTTTVTVTFSDDTATTYSFLEADPALQRRQAIDEIFIDWYNIVAQTVEASYPHILKSIGIFSPVDVRPDKDYDNVLARGSVYPPLPVSLHDQLSNVDVLDFHIYRNYCNQDIPPLEISVCQFDQLTSKPLMLGEHGIHKYYSSCPDSPTTGGLHFLRGLPAIDDTVLKSLTLTEFPFEHMIYSDTPTTDCANVNFTPWDTFPLEDSKRLIRDFRDNMENYFKGRLYWSWNSGDLPGINGISATDSRSNWALCFAVTWNALEDNGTTTSLLNWMSPCPP